MNVFLVHFTEDVPDEAIGRLEQVSATGVYSLDDKLLLVHSDVDNPRVLSVMLDMTQKADPPIGGVVLKLNGSYAGYNSSELWTWLREAREESGVKFSI